VSFGHLPQLWKNEESERVDDDRVGHREKADGSRSEHQRGHGDERVRRVDIAAETETT